jgi:hypothetical protein
MSVMRCCAAFPEWACDGHAGRGSNQSSGIGRIGRCLSCLRRYRRADRWPDPFVADRRGWPLGAGQGRADLVPRNRADIGRLDDDAFLSLAVSALFRHRASARGAPAWANGCRRRGSDVAAARLFRPAARHRVDRRQEPTDVKPGVYLTRSRRCGFRRQRPVAAWWRYQERIVARAWPASENRIAVVELTY